jgi:hypothetical protein
MHLVDVSRNVAKFEQALTLLKENPFFNRTPVAGFLIEKALAVYKVCLDRRNLLHSLRI